MLIFKANIVLIEVCISSVCALLRTCNLKQAFLEVVFVVVSLFRFFWVCVCVFFFSFLQLEHTVNEWFEVWFPPWQDICHLVKTRNLSVFQNSWKEYLNPVSASRNRKFFILWFGTVKASTYSLIKVSSPGLTSLWCCSLKEFLLETGWFCATVGKLLIWGYRFANGILYLLFDKLLRFISSWGWKTST